MHKFPTLMIFVFGMMALISGCGSGSETKGNENKYVFPSSLPADAPVTEIVLNSNDQMQYDQEILTVKGGSRVKLTLNHTGQISKAAMGHNVVILKAGVKLEEYAREALKASGAGYIPDNDQAVAFTKMIGGGETTAISFDAPAPGTYEFVCTYPGHYLLMQGKLIVE